MQNKPREQKKRAQRPAEEWQPVLCPELGLHITLPLGALLPHQGPVELGGRGAQVVGGQAAQEVLWQHGAGVQHLWERQNGTNPGYLWCH